MKLLSTWLDAIEFIKFLGANTAKLKPNAIPHCKIISVIYWYFLRKLFRILNVLSILQLKHGLFLFNCLSAAFLWKYLHARNDLPRLCLQKLYELSFKEPKMSSIQVCQAFYSILDKMIRAETFQGFCI